jgi:XRE family aerobic/anaerobic benzoate catabolism transcriptional regulator
MNEITNFRGEVVKSEADHTREELDSAFVAMVGSRVRKARERKGVARRVLSEQSRVSQRYLAQLENGGGNISITLLKRIADALDYRVEWLLSEEDPWSSDAVVFAEQFRAATVDQRQKVIQILNPAQPEQLRRQRLCLLGLRGAGKSTLGKQLSRKLDLPFIELNREIEELSGMAVTEVMAMYGHEGYRRLERQAVERIVALSDAVILAVAGGIVSEPETYGYLLRNFHTVWLKASPEEHMQRVRAQGDERPMAGNPQAMSDLRSILTSREALYARAEAMVDTSGKSVEQSLEELVEVSRALIRAR